MTLMVDLTDVIWRREHHHVEAWWGQNGVGDAAPAGGPPPRATAAPVSKIEVQLGWATTRGRAESVWLNTGCTNAPPWRPSQPPWPCAGRRTGPAKTAWRYSGRREKRSREWRRRCKHSSARYFFEFFGSEGRHPSRQPASVFHRVKQTLIPGLRRHVSLHRVKQTQNKHKSDRCQPPVCKQ